MILDEGGKLSSPKIQLFQDGAGKGQSSELCITVQNVCAARFITKASSASLHAYNCCLVGHLTYILKSLKRSKKSSQATSHSKCKKKSPLLFFFTLSDQLENGLRCESEKLNGHYHHALFERS